MAKFKPTTKLPDKPSALIRLAIDDITKVEQMKTKYKIDMDTWHQPATTVTDPNDFNYEYSANHDPKKRCAVCLAGSVMACTLKVDPTLDVTTDNFDKDTENKLDAIDAFRCGDLHHAFETLGLAKKFPRYLMDEIEMVDYSSSPKKFKEEQLHLADVLEALGF